MAQGPRAAAPPALSLARLALPCVLPCAPGFCRDWLASVGSATGGAGTTWEPSRTKLGPFGGDRTASGDGDCASLLASAASSRKNVDPQSGDCGASSAISSKGKRNCLRGFAACCCCESCSAARTGATNCGRSQGGGAGARIPASSLLQARPELSASASISAA
eukprot:scaffold191378_cov28-Tisochrysis_lutea.AAC.5